MCHENNNIFFAFLEWIGREIAKWVITLAILDRYDIDTCTALYYLVELFGGDKGKISTEISLFTFSISMKR